MNLGTAIGYLDLDTSKFTRGFKNALSDLKTFQSESMTANQKLGALGSSLSSVGSSLTKGLTLPLVGAGTAVVSVAANFESSMSKVMAITDTAGQDATEVYTKLSNKAKEMGASTRYSASEAADALYYMSLAGWNANESIAGLDGVLQLAAASGMELGQASDMVTDYLTAFGLQSEYATNMADALAFAQANSNTTTQLLGDAFGNCATQAHAFGSSLEETVSYLATLANSGLKGSEAGTALSAVFRDITQKMDDGAIKIGDVSVAVMDAEGNFRSLTDILTDVAAATEGLGTAEKSAALMATFTSRSIKAANILLDEGAESIDEFTQKLFESQGTAAEQSEAMLDNLQGQITILKSALEGVAISFGEIIVPFITKAAQAVTDFLGKINSLDDKTKKTIVTIASILAVAGPVLLLVGKLATGISAIINVVSLLKPAFAALNAVMAANPIVLIIAAIAALVAAFVYLWNNCEEFRNFWISLWESVKEVAKIVIDSLVVFFTETIPAAVEAVIEWLQNFVSKVQEFFTETVPEAINALADWFAELPYRIGYAIGVVIGTVANWAVELYNLIITEVPKIINAVVTFFTELPEKIWNWLVEAFNKVSIWISNVWNKIQEEIPKIINAIVTFFSELPGKLWDWLVETLTKLGAWASDAIAFLSEKVPEIVDSIVKFFEDLPETMLNIGKNLINGLWNGISSAAGWLGDQISSFGSGVVDGFKSVFGIASPSKVMAEQGKYLVEGLEEGMEDEESGLLGLASSIADAVVGRIQDLGSKVSFGLGSEEDQENLESYNSYLSVTLLLYTQIREQLEACTNYTTQMASMGYSMVQSMLPYATEAEGGMMLFSRDTSSSESKNPLPSSREQTDGKPDMMTINLTIGEENIETVVVDLLKREVRS